MLRASIPRLAYGFFLVASIAWVAAGVRLAMAGDWTGAVICGVGLLGTAMIVSSLRSRSRRPMYGERDSGECASD